MISWLVFFFRFSALIFFFHSAFEINKNKSNKKKSFSFLLSNVLDFCANVFKCLCVFGCGMKVLHLKMKMTKLNLFQGEIPKKKKMK